MIRVNLPPTAVARPGEVFRTAGEVELRRRVPIVLMAHRGRPRGDIATDLGCSRSSVRRWLDADPERGPDGLTPREATGAEPELTPDRAPVIRRWVIDGPAEQGPDRANWTYPELADHPYKAKGARVGKSALPAFGAKHGIRPYRPTCRFPRGDPAEPAEAREEIAELERGRERATSSCRAKTRPGPRWPRPRPRRSG